MNRESKFRGKSKDGKTWLYGAYYKHQKVTLCIATEREIKENELHLIIKGGFSDWNLPAKLEYHETIPETVGEYTGLHDKNGKEIYEGDILKRTYTSKDGEVTKLYVVIYDLGCFYCVELKGVTACSVGYYTTLVSGNGLEVIGNIHDNPEIMVG